MTFGVYPDVPARDARDAHKAARAQVRDKTDPMVGRKLEKLKAQVAAANDFEGVARELWAKKRKAGSSAGYVDSVVEKLEKDVFPWIGSRPVSQVEEPEILAILNRVEARAPETARRLRGFCGQVFRYAIATSRAKHDPTVALKGAAQLFRRVFDAMPFAIVALVISTAFRAARGPMG
jgi:hypothetical protein